jgi:tungstate transport system ATP-binding protein
MTLTATGVSRVFDDTPILKDVSLTVEPGEVLTIVGPSGTGKTTLLRTLACFEPPDAGTIHWHDTDCWGASKADRLAVRRRMSMVFQEPSLFNASVRRNVTYGVRVRRQWRERARHFVRDLTGGSSTPESVRRALETVGLEDAADRNARSLSGGEAQRVAFARAVAVDPAVMFLDEPTSNLDPRNTAVIEAAIDRACDRGVGVLVATHDLHQAERVSDRVGFLFDGELVELTDPATFFDDPDDPRTARFVHGELVYAEGDDDLARAARR